MERHAPNAARQGTSHQTSLGSGCSTTHLKPPQRMGQVVECGRPTRAKGPPLPAASLTLGRQSDTSDIGPANGMQGKAKIRLTAQTAAELLQRRILIATDDGRRGFPAIRRLIPRRLPRRSGHRRAGERSRVIGVDDGSWNARVYE
jgi:hypothetical protein